jgi:hypothetical protein
MARELLDGMAGGKVESLYEKRFSVEFRNRVSPEKWQQMASDYREALGDVESLRRLRANVKRIEGYGEGQIIYEVKWVKGAGRLMLNITEVEDGWKISSFDIVPEESKDTEEKEPSQAKTKV